jgi:DNA repair exonuclease SbcCD ATPase subunit
MSGYEPELLPSATLERLVELLRTYETTPRAVSDAEFQEPAEGDGCIRQHMLLGFRCEFLDMLRGEEERLSPELQARLALMRTTHEQYMATAIVDRYACGHMVQLYNDLRGQHEKHEILCTELEEFNAELADAKTQRDALRAECEGVRSECAGLRAQCERQQALALETKRQLAEVQAQAQEQSRMLDKSKQEQKKMDEVLAALEKMKQTLNTQIDSLREQERKEKALLFEEQGLPGLEKALNDLEKVLEETTPYKMMVCQALSDVDGCALDM